MMMLVRPFTLNFWEPMVFLLNLYIALIYGLLYIWFESTYLHSDDAYRREGTNELTPPQVSLLSLLRHTTSSYTRRASVFSESSLEHSS